MFLRKHTQKYNENDQPLAPEDITVTETEVTNYVTNSSSQTGTRKYMGVTPVSLKVIVSADRTMTAWKTSIVTYFLLLVDYLGECI